MDAQATGKRRADPVGLFADLKGKVNSVRL